MLWFRYKEEGSVKVTILSVAGKIAKWHLVARLRATAWMYVHLYGAPVAGAARVCESVYAWCVCMCVCLSFGKEGAVYGADAVIRYSLARPCKIRPIGHHSHQQLNTQAHAHARPPLHQTTYLSVCELLYEVQARIVMRRQPAWHLSY